MYYHRNYYINLQNIVIPDWSSSKEPSISYMSAPFQYLSVTSCWINNHNNWKTSHSLYVNKCGNLGFISECYATSKSENGHPFFWKLEIALVWVGNSGVARGGGHWAIAQYLKIYSPKIFGDDGYCPALKTLTDMWFPKTQSGLAKIQSSLAKTFMVWPPIIELNVG